MKVFLGFDPGGATVFGWCALRGSALPLERLGGGVAAHADEALTCALEAAGNQQIEAIGIDAPLFWRKDGDRRVDQLLRNRIIKMGAHGGTVNSVNSMRGACAIQGIIIGMLARQKLGKNIPLTESHPKATLWLLRIATRENPPVAITFDQLAAFFSGEFNTEHERDAAIGALSAFAMTNSLPGWRDVFPVEIAPVLPLAKPLGYCLPE